MGMQRRYLCNDRLFGEQSERGKYWLGFCAADAHVQGNSLQLKLARKDREVLEHFREDLETAHPIYDYNNGGYPSSSLFVTSSELCAQLLSFRPETIVSCPSEIVNHLARGLFDGDGSVTCRDYLYGRTKTYHRQVEVVGEENVLAALRDVVALRAGTTVGHLRPRAGIWSWFLAGRHNLSRLYTWLYDQATVYLARKQIAFQF